MGLLLLAGAGLIAGVINTVAGGGSLVSLPALLAFGLPIDVANATNRIGVLLQCLTATDQFRKAGAIPAGVTRPLVLPAMAGALIGGWISVDLDELLFGRIVAVAMVVMLALVWWQPERRLTSLQERPWYVRAICFFLIGIYGGFLQAGVGIFLIVGLTLVAGLDLVRANALKSWINLLMVLPPIVVFVSHGLVAWGPALALSIGFGAGGWLGSRMSLKGGAPLIRVVLTGVVLISAVKLWQGGL